MDPHRHFAQCIRHTELHKETMFLEWKKHIHTMMTLYFQMCFWKKYYIPPWASFHKHLHKEGTEGDGERSVSWVRDSTPPRAHQLQLEQHSDLKKQDEELHFTQSSAVTLCASGDIWRMCLSVQNEENKELQLISA